MLKDDKINIADDAMGRGWYICTDAPKGSDYLYPDGKIRHGCLAHTYLDPFWATEQEAIKFYKLWKEMES